MKTILDDVKAFHNACDIPVLSKPTIPNKERIDLRSKLLAEEFQEYLKAVKDENIVEIADAIGDLIYVAVGTALEFGIPLERIWNEIQRTNMAKTNASTGKVVRRSDGKILKPDGWKPPDIRKIINES